MTTANVWDGQTVVLMGNVATEPERPGYGVPILADLPLAGPLFRINSPPAKKKKFLIFITPTLIDPAGNRLHFEEEMPFATNRIPPQPADLKAGK